MKILENDWLTQLTDPGIKRDKALGELRQILLKTVKTGLDGRAGNDDAFIEDVVQDALLRILDKLDTFQGKSKFTTWATAIALRIAFVELRRKHWQNIPFDSQTNQDIPTDHNNQTPSLTPYEDLSRKQFIDLMHHLIKTKLTDRQREVLIAELHGLPQDEIVARLGGTRNSVYKAGHDARKALKRELESFGHGVETFRDIFNSSTQKPS